MIRVVEGPPGSGKSYFGVSYLKNHCSFDELYQEYIVNDGVVVISNIEGLKIKHLFLDELIKRFTIEKFFTVENFEIIIEKYRAKNIILLIDESHKYFDAKFYDKNVFYFFQFHRHLGVDIILFTTNVSSLCRHIPPLAEFIVKAAPRSKGIVGTFRYKFCDQKGNYLFSKVLKIDKKIFKYYKSFDKQEIEKPRNVIGYWIVVTIVLFISSIVVLKTALAGVSKKGKKDDKKTVSVQPAFKPVSSAKPASPAPVAAVAPLVAPVVKADRVSRSPRSPRSKPLPLPPPRAVEDSGLMTYPVQAYAQVNEHKYYKVNGRFLPASSVLEYDDVNNTAVVPVSVAGKPKKTAVVLPGSELGG